MCLYPWLHLVQWLTKCLNVQIQALIWKQSNFDSYFVTFTFLSIWRFTIQKKTRIIRNLIVSYEWWIEETSFPTTFTNIGVKCSKQVCFQSLENVRKGVKITYASKGRGGGLVTPHTLFNAKIVIIKTLKWEHKLCWWLSLPF